ncbi:MAG: hypothetical protein A4S12_08100 [Proteobacteria bacterium SG_bin5]|nr:MAG: hypothetical protein A4S12_08100 [Proteobacteria bacterium SG_bin5]
MATMRPLDPACRKMTVQEFLDADLGDAKAELVDGVIFMMAGGSAQHAAIATNLIALLRTRLRGQGCRPYGSDLAVQTGDFSIRFPDVSVYCGTRPRDPSAKLIGDPVVLFEILSPSTAALDQRDKLPEYRALEGVQTIVLIDPERQRCRLVERTGPEAWRDAWLPEGADLPIAALDVTLPHGEIFALD